MKFTREIPTENGLYWVMLYGESCPRIVELDISFDDEDGWDYSRLWFIGSEIDGRPDEVELWGERQHVPLVDL